MARSGPDRGDARPSQRRLRVGEAVRRALVELLERTEWRDPDLAGARITVSEVSVSPDLKAATAWVMPLGGEGREAAVAALARAAPFLRGRVARRAGLRAAPRLEFRLDTAFDASDRMAEVMRGLAPAGPEPGGGAGGGEDGDGA